VVKQGKRFLCHIWNNGVYLKSFIIPPQISKEYSVRKIVLILFIVLASQLVLLACTSSTSDAPAQAVQSYLDALVAKDVERLPTLVCGEWEEDALIELDSLQAVSARLEGVACTQTGTEGDTALVDCTGNIVLTYDTEDQNIDLTNFTYQVIQEGGDWLVCGKR
jgi:hypothetical protein